MHISHSRRNVIKQILGGVAVAAVGRTGAAYAQSETLRIACIYPLSGAIGMMGNAMLAGAKIAADEINRSGGVLNKKIELVIRDDKASPAEAALVARETLGSGIKFVLGGLLTAPSMAVNGLLQENNAVFLQTGAQVMGLTHENFNPNAFRLNVNAYMAQSAGAMAMPLGNPNVVKWGSIIPDNQFGHDNSRLFTTALRKAYKTKLNKDIEVMDPIAVPFPATDFKVAISRLMASDIEGLYMAIVGADMLTFMGQAKQLGLYNKIKVFVDSGVGVQVADSLGTNLPKDSLWTWEPWFPYDKDMNAVGKQLVKDWSETSKAPINGQMWHGHTGMLALANAIRNAKSQDPAAVRTALESVQFESANGPFRFRKEDHQGIARINVFRFTQKPGGSGWEVPRVITVAGEDVIEPPSPGQKFAL